MSVQSVVVFLLIFQTVFTQRDTPCTTPNKDSATCVPARTCKVIIDEIQTQKESSIAFAKESQCGYDTEPLVCCGPVATYNYFSIFTEAPEIFDPAGIFTTPNPIDIFAKPGTESSEQSDTITGSFNTNGLPDRTVCGLDQGASRIIGGQIADMEDFPWMAALEYKSKLSGQNAGIRCGGSVINNKYVLTAAHCIISTEFEIISVWLGEWKISTDPDCDNSTDMSYCSDSVQKLKIEEVLPHPFYSQKTQDNDIGLLKLEKDVNYTSYIRPICLPQADLPPPEYRSYLTVAGWGATENGTTSDIKLKVAVPLISNEQCHIKLKNNRTASANQLCAGGEEGKDSCQGDSGGPLMRMYTDKSNHQIQWYQEGVVSYGVGCGRMGHPAVYTRVSRYISWIINNIKGKN